MFFEVRYKAYDEIIVEFVRCGNYKNLCFYISEQASLFSNFNLISVKQIFFENYFDCEDDFSEL